MSNSNKKVGSGKNNLSKEENKLNMPLVCIYFGLVFFMTIILIYFLTKYAL